MRSDLKEAKQVLKRLGEGRPVSVLAAVSGGLDSMCLLHLLANWGREQNVEVTAAHFHHGLRGEFADRDAAFVQEICAKWRIPSVIGRGDTRLLAAQEGLSLEEAARDLRYAFLEEQREAHNCAWILTAHHADDNAETMLLNLLRGTGTRGLTGIPECRGSILRPFLRVTREELAAYAAEYHIPHVEDETNRELDAARNVLRQKVLPVLRELNPCAVENMGRTAELLLQDEETLARQAEEFVENHANLQGDDLAELPVRACGGLSRAVISRAMLLLMARIGGRRQDLSHVHVEAAVKLLVQGRSGQEVSLPYGMKAIRTAETLVICKEKRILLQEVPVMPGQEILFGDWRVSVGGLKPEQGEYYYNVSVPKGSILTVSCWNSADRVTIPGSSGGRTVKRLVAERGISHADRDRLPVLRVDGCPAAIPGVGIDEKFTPEESNSVLVTFFKTNRGETS